MASFEGGHNSLTEAFLNPKVKHLYIHIEFEVFAQTPGVHFTKYAKDICNKLGVKGWMRFNTKRGSVVGQLEGEKDRIDEVAMWLKLQGAPGSKIEKFECRSWQIIENLSFREFKMRF